MQQSLNDVVERIRQHPGQQQVDRAVKVDVPGKHFPQLQAAEQKIDYAGTAVEYAERHKFSIHRKAWGNAHVGEGIRSLRVADWGHELGSTLTVLDACEPDPVRTGGTGRRPVLELEVRAGGPY